MRIEPTDVRLGNGETCHLRSPEPGDAAAMLAHARRIAEETEFVTSYRDEIDVTIEDEIDLIDRFTASVFQLCVLAFVGARLVGVCMIRAKGSRRKLRHRADLGISVEKDHWHLGVGRALLETSLEAARQLEITQIELAVYETNERAKRLYERFGFREAGFLPNAARLKDGRVLGEYLMYRPTDANGLTKEDA